MKHRRKLFVAFFVAGIAALIYSTWKKESSDLESLAHLDDDDWDDWDSSDLFEEE